MSMHYHSDDVFIYCTACYYHICRILNCKLSCNLNSTDLVYFFECSFSKFLHSFHR